MTADSTTADAFAISQRPAVLAAHAASEVLAAFLLFGGAFAVLAFAIAPYLRDGSAKGAAVGATVAALVVLIVKSPLGSLSGAHMNPAVSFAFWAEGALSRRELATYVAAQLLGGVAAALAMRWLWPGPFAAIGDGVTRPAVGLSPFAAAGLEFVATFGLVSLLFLMMSARSLTAYTALAKGGYLGLAVFLLQPFTGPSLNPARSLGPAFVADRLDGQWIYLVAPLLGAATAVAWRRLVPIIPPPKFHRFNHNHDHFHYTLYLLNRLSASDVRRDGGAPGLVRKG